MDIERAWRALTTGERTILAASAVLVGVLLVTGALLLGLTPFQAAQTVPGGGDIVDSDGDGLSDDNEALLFGTDPDDPDSDGDGIPDGWEAEHAREHPSTGQVTPDPGRADADDDPDEDGLTNAEEFEADTDPWRADSDGDGLADGWEVDSGHDPLDAITPSLDSDGDGLDAGREFDHGTLDNTVDTDGDGLLDPEEIRGSATIAGESFAFSPTDPAAYATGGSGLADGFAVVYELDPHGANVGRVDHDSDGLTSGLEARASFELFDDPRTALIQGLDPTDQDTDGDSLPDGWEVTHDLDPLDPADGSEDSDGDGLTNGREFFWRTDPLEADTDGDALEDGTEVEGFTITVDGNERQATSNPRLADSDGDGLDDRAERQGQATIEGTQITFNKTHPLLPDTDGDGLSDADEIRRSFGDGDRLDPTRADTDGDGLLDGRELEYWDQRRVEAEQDGLPSNLPTPTAGACQAQASGAIQSGDPSVLGPGGDPDGDCVPNILDPDSDRAPDSRMPPGTQPVLDGREVEPPERNGRTLPASDPAIPDTDGDGLPDEWELRWARFATDPSGSPTWFFDPTEADSDGDGTTDGEDDDEGQANLRGTPTCWDSVVYPDFDPSDPSNAGDGVPWGPGYSNTDEMDQDTTPIGSRACDSDEDGLVDGWEARPRPHLDPKSELASRWVGAYVQTACYPSGLSQNPRLADLDDIVALEVNDAPPTGAVPVDEDGNPPSSLYPDELLPPEEPGGSKLVWAASQTGCSWTGTGAEIDSGQCPDCRLVGITVTLDLRQWFKLSPPSGSSTVDTDGDGAPDAWEMLWWDAGEAQGTADRLDPFQADQRDNDNDGAQLADEFQEGCSPLTADTDGDGENDGPDGDCLSRSALAVPIEDTDGDHLLDDPCTQGEPPGTFQPTTGSGQVDQDRVEAARATGIIEVEPARFLCEPRSDPDGTTVDSDGDSVHDAVEMLQAYRAVETPKLLPNQPTHDPDEDGITTLGELSLGKPAGWPEETAWWFGSQYRQANGYDADGDGLADGLLLDAEPFENLPAVPSPDQAPRAFEIACLAGIVRPLSVPVAERCPGATGSSASSTFEWASSSQDTSLTVSLSDVGEPEGGDRMIHKDGTDLSAEIEVSQDDAPVADTPVAILALDTNEAQRLKDGDLSVLAQPERVLCILRTDGSGASTGSGCTVASGPASADLSGTDRSWLGSQTPAWTRDLSILDPTESDDLREQPRNQPKLIAWAMGEGTSVGSTDEQAVIVHSAAAVSFSELPEHAASGETITVTARVVDSGGDPLQDGSVTLTSGDEERTVPVTGSPTVSLPDVPLPNATQALDHDLSLGYRLSPMTFVAGPSNEAEATIAVLPKPTINVDPPGQAIANTTVTVGVTVLGPGQTPVSGPVNLTLAGAQATGSTGADGTASIPLTIPEDVRPRTATLTVSFEGTDAFGPTEATRDIPVRQRLRAEVAPTELQLGTETAFSVELSDLAGRAPQLPVQVHVSLGNASGSADLPALEQRTAVALSVEGDLVDTVLTVTANTSKDRQYAPLSIDVPVHVQSTARVSLSPDEVPRGERVDVTASVTDVLDRPVPEGQLSVSWPSGNANVTIEDGTASIPFQTPASAAPEPVTVTMTAQGPGLASTHLSNVINLRVGTNLSADVEVDALAGLVSVPFRLTDDQGAPIPGAEVNVSWQLGRPVTAQTDAEGRGEATLSIPDDAEPGDVPVQVRYPGDDVHLPAEAFETVPVRSAVRFDVPDEVVWSAGRTLSITGRLVQAESGEPAPLPVRAIQGDDVVAESDATTPFTLSMEPEAIAEFAGDARRFTLRLATNGSEELAPAETTVLVQRKTPVSIATSVNRTDDGATVRIRATTPDGPLSGARIAIGQENGPPTTVETDPDGEATVQLSSGTGTLVARYQGDEAHTPAQATIQLAEPAAPPAQSLAWLVALGILALLAVDAWIVHRVLQRLRLGRQVDEVLSDLEDRLVAQDEIQAAIYRAYLQLRATAEVLGEPEAETETVREFGTRFADRLELEASAVMGLIGIFEQAWYGEVDPSMRTEAIEELRDLQDHMRERGLVA